MKKIYSFLTAALLTASAAYAVDLPYEAPVPTAAPEAPNGGNLYEWTQVATSGPSWTVASAGNITYNGSNVYAITAAMLTVQTDSWLISPEFRVEQGKDYKVTFSLKCATSSSRIENLDVYLAGYFHFSDYGLSSLMEDYSEAYKSVDLSEQAQTYKDYSVTIKAIDSEPVSFAFRAHGTQTGGYIGIANIKISEAEGGEEPPVVDPDPEPDPEPGDHVCAAKQFTPYSSTIAAAANQWDNGWTMLNAGQGNDWVATAGTSLGTSNVYAQYTYNSTYEANTFICSPSIHLDGGQEYVVMYGIKTSSNSANEDLSVYASASIEDANKITSGILIQEHAKYSNTNYTPFTIKFTPKVDGDYHICFHEHSDKDRYTLYLGDFSIVANKFAPAGVSNFTATADANHDIKATLSWTLPTTSIFGEPFTEEQTVEKVEIYRDGGETAIATLDGPVTTYEDTEANGLTIGRHTYSIVVTVAGAKSAAVASNETGYVGPEPAMSVPYTSTVARSAGVFDDWWKVINHNEDAKTWEAKTNTTAKSGLCAMYTFNGSMDADDYLISPAIYMEAGKFYNIEFGYWTGNDPEVVTLYAAQNNTVEAIQAGKQLMRMDGCFKTLQEKAAPFSPTTTGNYYFAFHVTTVKNKYYTYVSDFSVTEAPFKPAPVSDFKAIADPDGALKVSLSWTLPTTTAYDTPLTEEQTVESVEIYRDGSETVLVTLPGTATSFDDTEETGLTSGRHSYTIVVTVAGVKSEVVSSGQTSYVALLPAEIPATFIPENQTELDDKYVIIKGETSQANGWSYNTSYHVIRFAQGYYKQEDDMIIFPPLAVREAGYYRVTLNSKINSASYVYKLLYVYGTEPTKSGMNIVGQAEGLTTSYEDHYFDFYAPEAGTYYVGVWANNMAVASPAIYDIDKIEVTKSSLIPSAVSDLTAAVAADGELSFTLSWTNPTTSFAGGTITKDDYKIEVYLGEELYTTLEGDALVEGTQTLDVTVDAAGVYTATVKAVGPEGDSAPKTPTVTTAWVGPKVVSVPYSVAFSNYQTDPTVLFWDTFDGNSDSKCWTLQTGGYYMLGAASKNEDGLYEYKDYLFSPEMELKAGQSYQAVYNMNLGGSTATKLYYNIGVVAAGEFNPDHSTWVNVKTCQCPYVSTNANAVYTYQFTVPADGKYKVVIAADEYMSSDFVYDYQRPRLYNFAVELPVPDVATELAVVPDLNYALEATLTWVNPANNSFGQEMSMGDITKAIIYRGTSADNLEEIATISEIDNLNPGATSIYVDKTIPASGTYTYKVEIYNEVGCSKTPAATVNSSWIGAGTEIPADGGLGIGKNFDKGFTSGEWRVLSTNGNIPEFSLAAANIGATSWKKVPDAWFISRDLFQFELNTLYEITVRSYNSYDTQADDPAPVMSMHIGGSDIDPAQSSISTDALASFNKIGEWTIPVTAKSGSEHQEKMLAFFVHPSTLVSVMSDDATQPTKPENDPDVAASTKVAAGPSRLAFNSQSTGSYYVNHIKLDVKRTFTGVDEIEAAANGVIFDGKAICFDGKASVHVYSMTGALVLADMDAVDTVSLEHLANGAYIVTVVPENGKAVTFKVVK